MLSSGHFFAVSLRAVSQTTGQADTSNRYIHDLRAPPAICFRVKIFSHFDGMGLPEELLTCGPLCQAHAIHCLFAHSLFTTRREFLVTLFTRSIHLRIWLEWVNAKFLNKLQILLDSWIHCSEQLFTIKDRV